MTRVSSLSVGDGLIHLGEVEVLEGTCEFSPSALTLWGEISPENNLEMLY